MDFEKLKYLTNSERYTVFPAYLKNENQFMKTEKTKQFGMCQIVLNNDGKKQ